MAVSEEKSINLLWHCAQELSTHTHAERLLKSYYTNTCRKIARHNVQLPEDCVGTARMCVRCGNQWTDGNYQLQLRPQRLANNAKRRRLIAQLDMDKAKRQRGQMSIGARKRAKWLKKRMASSIAVDCSLCGHNTVLPLEKPKKRLKAAIAETIAAAATTTTTVELVGNKKKKKKNKTKNQDINAGLKLLPEQQQKTPTAPKAVPTKPPTTKTTPATAGQSNKQKQKSKAAQSTSKPAASTAPKVQSKTQKQNALLRLAAQLKSQAAKNASKTPQNRLQAFLK